MARVAIDHQQERGSLDDLAKLTVELQQVVGLAVYQRAERLTPRDRRSRRRSHIADAYGVEAGGVMGVGPGGVAAALAAAKPFGKLEVFNADWRFRFIDEGTSTGVRPGRYLERAGESAVDLFQRDA